MKIKMSSKVDQVDFWEDPSLHYLVNRILSTFPKLSSGAKFDKVFKTDSNRYEFRIIFVYSFVLLVFFYFCGLTQSDDLYIIPGKHL